MKWGGHVHIWGKCIQGRKSNEHKDSETVTYWVCLWKSKVAIAPETEWAPGRGVKDKAREVGRGQITCDSAGAYKGLGFYSVAPWRVSWTHLCFKCTALDFLVVSTQGMRKNEISNMFSKNEGPLWWLNFSVTWFWWWMVALSHTWGNIV